MTIGSPHKSRRPPIKAGPDSLSTTPPWLLSTATCYRPFVHAGDVTEWVLFLSHVHRNVYFRGWRCMGRNVNPNTSKKPSSVTAKPHFLISKWRRPYRYIYHITNWVVSYLHVQIKSELGYLTTKSIRVHAYLRPILSIPQSAILCRAPVDTITLCRDSSGLSFNLAR